MLKSELNIFDKDITSQFSDTVHTIANYNGDPLDKILGIPKEKSLEKKIETHVEMTMVILKEIYL